MTTVAFDLTNPELVAHELEAANRRLSREREVAASITALVSDLCEQILDKDSRSVGRAGIEANAWIDIQQVAYHASRAARDDENPRRQRRELRLQIERLRFLLMRLAEQEPLSDDRSPKEVLQWLDRALTVGQAEKASLLGVGGRTYQRWISEAESSEPTGEDERRLRLIARAVLDLRGVLTTPGVVAWLGHEHPRLGGRTPLGVIDEGDEAELRALLSITGGARAGAAA